LGFSRRRVRQKQAATRRRGALCVRRGLDEARFREALSTQRHGAEVKRDFDAGNALGIEGTPAFLVNDYLFVGAVPFEIMRVVVDRALSDAGE
jgi:predicted DsbA family dithiol-disulfide isomerase